MVEDKFVQVFLKGYTNSMAKDFKTFLDEDLYVDLIFICGDKRRVKAHQLMLSFLSQFLHKILIEYQFDSSRKIAHINIPDVRFDVMERIIQFLYTGQIILDATYLKEFHEVMQLLGMPSCTFIHTNEIVSPSLVEINASESRINLEAKKTVESYTLAAGIKRSLTSCENSKHCAVALAICENTNCTKQLMTLPAISEVKSLSQTRLNAATNSSVISSAAANLSYNEEESIKKIAKNLFVHLKRISEVSRKVEKDKIHKRYTRCLSKNEKHFQESYSTKKLIGRRRCCTARQFIDGQMETNSFA